MLIATYLNFYDRINNEFVLSHFFEENFKLLKEPTVLNYFFLYGFITLGTLFMLQINDKFGPGILWKFIAGKYHQPNIEKRIFMFLDMRSSTSIAEKIGNKKYFLLLNEIIADITATILNSEGEIYQYVGDEIVISWPMKKGIRNENFIRCFIQIKKKLLLKENHYKQKFGILPELKAGLHFGNVVAGEVGVIKKEIVYSGDVLNTTARIQEMCNHYGVDFLVSKEALGLIKETEFFEMTALGSIQLRGKKQKVEISSIK